MADEEEPQGEAAGGEAEAVENDAEAEAGEGGEDPESAGAEDEEEAEATFSAEEVPASISKDFFKKVADLQKVPTTKLDLKQFMRCLAALGTTMDLDEVECVLANLIYAGYIKGYISHQHGKLVVAKTGAFPALADVAGGK